MKALPLKRHYTIIENVIYYLSQIYKLFGFKNLLLITILVCIILIIKNKTNTL